MADPKHLRKRFRLRRLNSFSLRTALIAVTVLAVWLGLHMKSVRQQRAAIEAVQSLGCAVYYDYEATDRLLRTRNAESSVSIWLLDTFGRDHFHSVVFVEMGTEREANYEEVLRQLQEFPNLEKLSILGPQLTDSELKHVGEFTSLRVLIIPSGQHFTGRGLAHLAKLKRLERLILSRCQMTGESLRVLSELPKLEELWLSDSRYADGALKEVQNMTQLRVLALGKDVSDNDLVHLKQLTQLERLGVQYSDVTEAGLRHLVDLKNLRFLWLEKSRVKDASWLQERLPKCKIDL